MFCRSAWDERRRVTALARDAAVRLSVHALDGRLVARLVEDGLLEWETTVGEVFETHAAAMNEDQCIDTALGD